MNTYLFLNVSDFEFVGYKYKERKDLLSRTKLHKRGKKLRVYYYLPNEVPEYYNAVPELRSKKEQEMFLAEFREHLANGFLPKPGACRLRDSGYNPKDGSFEVYTQLYLTTYATKERSKGKKAKQSTLSVLRGIVEYFTKKRIKSICEITNKDIDEWSESLPFTPCRRSKKEKFLSPATRNGYRKIFRAYLRTAKDKGYPLQCEPDKMNIYEYKNGEIDFTVDARGVIYPMELVDAVMACSYKSDLTYAPEIKRIIGIWKELGFRPGEMHSLGEDNLVFENGRPRYIKIKEFLDCPHDNQMGFSPKNFASYRQVLLSDTAMVFIESLLERFKNVKRYGVVHKELVEYPFLFVFWDERRQQYVRNDRLMYEEFQMVTQHAMTEFNLKYEDSFIPYDLRRTCNLYLKTVWGKSDAEAAQYLGHSEETNRKHYTLDKDKLNISQKQMEKSFKEAASFSPELREKYSFQMQEGEQRQNNSGEVILPPKTLKFLQQAVGHTMLELKRKDEATLFPPVIANDKN